MNRIFTFILAVMVFISVNAYRYEYTFSDTPISQAIVRISKDHPEVMISFIYKELDNYRTSVSVHTDDIYDVIRQTVGLNPVSVIKKGDSYYIEALQHGKFVYTGNVVDIDNEPITGAMLLMLAPCDSTVITYGVTDIAGRFSIPCDKHDVIVKFTCLGYKTVYKTSDGFSLGTITMTELPIKLQTVNVEADNASIYSDRSVYRPTQRQKNASQTATDLLARMAIPQLDVALGSSSVSTISGQPVSIYINSVPATQDELRMMKMSDVKSVEYLEYPSDPRFQGNSHVINFVMTQYEYGGYTKLLGSESFIANTGLLQGNARFVHKKMTYDIMGYGNYASNEHMGADQIESFRLPQDDGSVKSFDRISTTESSRYRKQNYEGSFRALYSSGSIVANSQLSYGVANNPHNDNIGSVRYTDNVHPTSIYNSEINSNDRTFRYAGYYFFVLPRNNTLTTQLNYSYSHTRQYSEYSENGFNPIVNGANDDTHNSNGRFIYSHNFSKRHALMAFVYGLYERNKTCYSGSVNSLDDSFTKFGQTGTMYSYNGDMFSASLGFGWNWLLTKLNDNRAYSDFPYVDASIDYTFNRRSVLNSYFHYSVWPPSSNYKSENLIQMSPYMWHTGNPFLKSHRSYDLGINYTFIPSNRFSMAAFVSSWIVGDRSAFVYEATPEGIIRTVRQPIGQFGHYVYGINVSTTQLDGSLKISGRLSQLYVHNGKPYNVDRSYISYYAQALYYVKQFNFAFAYQSSTAFDNYDSMSGIWSKNKGAFVIKAGWGDSRWNVSITAQNMHRWNWRATREIMTSENYSVNRCLLNTSSHAFVKLTATYTFGFGKKINRENEIEKQSGASSGILK